jgi:hypothetical protein
MQINEGIHLAYCTNIHRGEGWRETFDGLKNYTLKVRDNVSEGKPFAIGLRLGNSAAIELSEDGSGRIEEFIKWLDENNCYVFTINGFPYGQFHGARVKEQVYRPDWTSNNRLEYTKLLFDILSKILPLGISGSVSTLPGSFKEFISNEEEQGAQIINNLGLCGDYVKQLRESTCKDLHLGLEPEPLGWFENTIETINFFERFRSVHGDKYNSIIGVNYDTCHLAIEYENANESLLLLKENEIRISKLHLSSALKLKPDEAAVNYLKKFEEDVYLHQVIARYKNGELVRFRDLPDPIQKFNSNQMGDSVEWRVHFHIPLHSSPSEAFSDTNDHIRETLEVLSLDPTLCTHLEMETYTWEVLPKSMQTNDVVDQLSHEYKWTLDELQSVGLISS